MIYVVNEGDTIDSIAAQFGVSRSRLIYDNQIYAGRVVTGQALLILDPSDVHTVQEGDTLTSIAQQYGTSVSSIVRKNPYLLNESNLMPGDVLTIRYRQEQLGNLNVTGYAYPYISTEILREVLLYLDELLIFSYGFTTEGTLIPPAMEEPLIEQALEFGVDPMLVLTPFAETGSFNNQLVKAVSEDIQMQQVLIENLVQTVQEKQYAGVDVDFEYILPEDREGYAAFVGNLRERMNPLGYKVSVALAPKISADQPGLLYEGMDYGLLGANADSVFLMTYEWGYTFGPPMAVAPINKVQQVLDYAVTEIPPEKIYMGIPNYAYNWPLPYERGTTRARTIGNVEAVEIADENGVQIRFDETAMSPFFNYTSNGTEHEVWFEDVRSIDVKVRTAKEYGFTGVGYWNLMRPFRANWLLLDSLFQLNDRP